MPGARTLADALREAREEAPDAADRGLDRAALQSRLVRKRRVNINPDNPTARCDTCPRTTSADKLAEIEPGKFSCDACRRRATREKRAARKRKRWERGA